MSKRIPALKRDDSVLIGTGSTLEEAVGNAVSIAEGTPRTYDLFTQVTLNVDGTRTYRAYLRK